jgi:hypothetical protein
MVRQNGANLKVNDGVKTYHNAIETTKIFIIKNNLLVKIIKLSMFLMCAMLMQFCSSSKKMATSDKAPSAPQKATATVFYQRDIMPIMQASCAPCHFPEKGKKLPLDTYAAVKQNIDAILYRVQLSPSESKFMPLDSKKPPFTPEQIQLLKQWKKEGMNQ